MEQQQTVWVTVREKHPECLRAENGYYGKCRAEVRLRYSPPGGGVWEVSVTVHVPNQKPWTQRREYRRIPAASYRFDEYRREADRRMAVNCPTR